MRWRASEGLLFYLVSWLIFPLSCSLLLQKNLRSDYFVKISPKMTKR